MSKKTKKPEPILNVSEETNQWNKDALALAKALRDQALETVGYDRSKCINPHCDKPYVVDCQEGRTNWSVYCDNCLCCIEMPTREEAIRVWTIHASGQSPVGYANLYPDGRFSAAYGSEEEAIKRRHPGHSTIPIYHPVSEPGKIAGPLSDTDPVGYVHVPGPYAPEPYFRPSKYASFPKGKTPVYARSNAKRESELREMLKLVLVNLPNAQDFPARGELMQRIQKVLDNNPENAT